MTLAESPVGKLGRLQFLAMLLLVVLACSGGDDAAPAPGTPATQARGATGAIAQTQAGGGDVQDQESDSTQLVREVFRYRGGVRDPFRSLVRPGGSDRPRVTDLKLTGIVYDAMYPVRSVAVVHDTVEDQRYELQVGGELGRFRVAEIRQREVIVAIDEFGVERQIVLSLRPQEDTP